MIPGPWGLWSLSRIGRVGFRSYEPVNCVESVVMRCLGQGYSLGELTRTTIDACTHPLIGGISWLQTSRTVFSSSLFVISHAGVMARAPRACSSSTKLLAWGLAGPERESSIKLRAPRSTSQRAMLLPRPPRPPAITYVASGPNVYAGFVSRTV